MKRVTPIKKNTLSVSSGLSLQGGGMTKLIQFGKQSFKARHVVIPANEVEEKTTVHHLNTRHQDSLTLDAVRDIYDEVKSEGIKQEGVAYFNKQTGKYELFDASRRRYCAIHTGQSLPLWVIDELPATEDVVAYIDLTQKVKRFSWREVGMRYIKFAQENGIDVNDMERIGAEFAISKETVRKKVSAALLDGHLIEAFPDCQGVPSSFYPKLAKIERTLKAQKVEVRTFVENAKASFHTDATDVEDIQRQLLEHLEANIEAIVKTNKSESVTKELAEFDDRFKYARLKTSANGRKTTFEFSRLPKEIMDDIEAYVREKLAEKS